MKFNHKSAASLLRGEKLGHDAMCEFVSDARWTFESYARVVSDLADLRAELVMRDAEIALLKSMVLELEGEIGENDD